MPIFPFHVLVIGGGIGGLCLAHGLRKAGIGVTVFERERSPAERPQGYRLSINPDGNQALHECLPATLFQQFTAACSAPTGTYRLIDEQIRELYCYPKPRQALDAIRRYRDICRVALRQVLLSGMEPDIRYGKRFVRYETRGAGQVVAHFADGSLAQGDLLVAADGTHSAVRRQFLPQAELVDTGIVSIAGKVLQESGCAFLPGVNHVLGPGGRSLFIAEVLFPDGPEKRGGYTMWTFSTKREHYAFPVPPEQMDSEGLKNIVLGMIRRWHPSFGRLIGQSDPATIQLWQHNSAAPVAAWATRNVTLIGDAIHAMSPFAGVGANTALRDAQGLCQQLLDVRDGRQSLIAAVQAYEAEMRRYGFAAVHASMQELERLTADSVLHRLLTRTRFRLRNFNRSLISHTPLAGDAMRVEV